MAKSALEIAKSFLKRRNFSMAIRILDGISAEYEGGFDYFLTKGIAYLYQGILGSAASCFQKARNIKMTDSTLLLAQAALFLRRGDTRRAIQYYLDVLDSDPNNKTAKQAMEFLRTKGTEETIMAYVDSGKISDFYPPLGFNSFMFLRIVLSALFGVALGFGIFFIMKPKNVNYTGNRGDLTNLALTVAERKNPQENDLSGYVIKYLLTESDITKIYDNAQEYFQMSRDNMAQVEINRILNSNAAFSIKQKANLLMAYLVSPGFDSLKDNFSYKQVAEDPNLYLDCFVDWSGRIANAKVEGETYKCDLLVGYENQVSVEGVVPVTMMSSVSQEIDPSKPVRILGKITTDSGVLTLLGKSVFQSVKN